MTPESDGLVIDPFEIHSDQGRMKCAERYWQDELWLPLFLLVASLLGIDYEDCSPSLAPGE